jgi:putative ABC transport system ATP-binding protein
MVIAFISMKRGSSGEQRKEKIQFVMEKFNIAHRRLHFPQQLSGGQQQRVAVARAIVSGPKLILADEPTGNLDSKNGEEVMNIILNLNREGTTVVMVTHSPEYAGYSSRIIRLFDGKIVSETAGG